MKLFVWASPYRIDYGSTMVFAVAETEEEARRIVEGAPKYRYCEFEQGTGGGVKLGSPTRVVDLPCAEWHEWQE